MVDVVDNIGVQLVIWQPLFGNKWKLGIVLIMKDL